MLLIDEIGKDVSGAGLDTNVVGRKYLEHAARDDEYPKIKYIVVRGLTAVTGGNATGIGLVEFCRSRIVREMDVRATRINCLTGSHATAAMVPLDYETDREILDVALSVIGLRPRAETRLMWIQNTLKVAEMECSEGYWEEARQREDLEILTEPRGSRWATTDSCPPYRIGNRSPVQADVRMHAEDRHDRPLVNENREPLLASVVQRRPCLARRTPLGPGCGC